MAENSTELAGKRILVVEDDYLLANDVCSELRELGATVLGPAPTPFYAMQLIGNRKLDAAVLDVRLHGATVFEVADHLVGRGVPIIFVTGYARSEMPRRFQMASLFEKPLDRPRLMAEIISVTKRLGARGTPMVEKSGSGLPLERSEEMFARALARSVAANVRAGKPD
ncbi:response regulator [Devosia rhizoryzae]|uniref:Response regulator n=1 Tax=Devosia rhizoryzae TaxID=2774137 RepID=A0ABX7C2Q9_9HYPH|nr:response regulator [Devosia rhizoryzae]QQR38027.1 response regulator [Devosia rhizoryzae]